ncbi:phosphotransferase [Marinomonas sp. 2405UD68-3]|uniref:phosphotransferase n=1 Tax=Marinomonas sp. 2405UD68-3 TaxID=3391835 RepID=UPI0039C99765
MSRIFSKVELTINQIEDIVTPLNLSIKEGGKISDIGRVSSNYLLETDQGKTCLRFYPKDYELAQIKREIDALRFFASQGLPVPLLIEKNASPLPSFFEGYPYFIYWCLPGTSLEQEHLSKKWAYEAGKLLSSLLQVSHLYASPDAAVNDYQLIEDAFREKRDVLKKALSKSVFSEMEEHLQHKKYEDVLRNSPKGLVHGDYFFENVLVEGDQMIGVIDFGDVYYGHPLTDCIIGAMEFSVLSDESVEMEYLKVFLTPLKRHLDAIEPEMFQHFLLLNCIRFLSYTIEDSEIHSSNSYLKRPEFKSEVRHFSLQSS